MGTWLKRVYPALYVVSLLLVLASLMMLACARTSPTLQLPETPRPLRSYPSPPLNSFVTYEHPQEHWRISYPATWEIRDEFAREGYSSTYIDPPWGSEMTFWGWHMKIEWKDIADRLDYQQEGGRNFDSYYAADVHLATAAEWDVDTPVREVIFLNGEDVTIEGYSAYLIEYLWVPDGESPGKETSWILGLFLVTGTDSFEVTLTGSPARMFSARNEMRDIVLSFQPPDNTPPPVASPTLLCDPLDAVITTDVRGESEPNVFEGQVNVLVTVIGTVTNTCNRSVDFNLLGVVYDKNGAILGISGHSYGYWSNARAYWEGRKADLVPRPKLVFHLAPGWHEQVRFNIWLSLDEFDRAASVAILVVP